VPAQVGQVKGAIYGFSEGPGKPGRVRESRVGPGGPGKARAVPGGPGGSRRARESWGCSGRAGWVLEGPGKLGRF